jgi:hypothetical protein
MAQVSPVPRGPDPERPTRAAQLKISAEPTARVKITARRWGSAEGTVPPAAARHLIAAFGILGCVVTGITGAVLTLRIGPGLTILALAELVVALASAMMIAVGGWIGDRGQSSNPSDQEKGS